MTDIIRVPTKKYVFFDKGGKILSISNNTRNKEHQYIEVEKAEVEDILNGKQSVESFCVVYDTLDKTYRLMHKNINERSWVSIVDSIFEIPQETNDNYDIKIIQDQKNYCWIFELAPGIKESVSKGSAEHGGWLNFSVTSKGDPHELYQMLRVKFVDLVINSSVRIPYYSQNKFDIDEISVYTMKRFENYHYEVVDE